MASHSSAAALKQSPHANNSTSTSRNNSTNYQTTRDGLNQTISEAVNQTISDAFEQPTSDALKRPITDALKRRAQSVINDKSIDAGTRTWIRYALEINDPELPELVRRVDAGETIVDNLNLPPTSEEKIGALAEIICQAGDGPSAALLVLMSTLENALHPKALANAAKHFALTRCTHSNVYGMVDAQIAVLECELLNPDSFAT